MATTNHDGQIVVEIHQVLGVVYTTETWTGRSFYYCIWNHNDELEATGWVPKESLVARIEFEIRILQQ